MKKPAFLTRNSSNGWSCTISPLRVLILLLLASSNSFAQPKSYRSEILELVPLNQRLYVHISWLRTNDFGKVPCNGLIYINKGGAYIFDSPANDTASQELIRVLQKKWKLKIQGVVATHFHDDCLGGLHAFHQAGIKSWAHQQTIDLARENGVPASRLPQHGFRDSLVQDLNGQPIIHRYFGEGHTRDNIVSYIPEQKALFGGCLVKEEGASMGFVGDANIAAWSASIEKIRQAYPDLMHVIPGHGKWGDARLLTYTFTLFKGADPGAGPEAVSKTEAPRDSLWQTIYRLDSAFFDAFNRKALDATMSFFAPDLEFYHDKGGMAGFADTKSSMKRLFDNNTDNGLRRDVVPGSFEVYPVPGFGAIQVNMHRFCHVEDNRLDCGVFRNIMVWKQDGGTWKILRVLSFDH